MKSMLNFRKKLAELKTVTVEGVDLIKPGVWPAIPSPIHLSEADLLTLRENLLNSTIDVTLGIGHSKDENFYQKLAEYMGIPEVLMSGDSRWRRNCGVWKSYEPTH